MKKVNLEMAIESFYVPLYVKAYDSKHALKCQDRNVAVVNEPIDIPLEALDRATVCKLCSEFTYNVLAHYDRYKAAEDDT